MIRHNNTAIDRKNLTIHHNGKSCKFDNSGKYKNRSLIFDATQHLMLNGWTTRSDLFDLLYGDDPDGGPETGPHTFDVMYAQSDWKKYLSKLGLKMIKDKRGGQQYLKLVDDK